MTAPTPPTPLVVETYAEPEPGPTGATVIQYWPGPSANGVNPVTVARYSVNPNPERPVATCVAAFVPENRSVPPFPAETPERTSQYAVFHDIVLRNSPNTVFT